MKTTKIFSIIALIAAASMAFVSCEDDMNKNFKPAQVGDEIFFGGTAGYEDEARTVYGEKGTTGTPIMWYEGDQVRIYCAEARQVEGKSYCDYKVNNVVPAGGEISTDKTSSTLTSTAAYGLQWGSEAEHKFYGVYPSPNMFAAGSSEANTYQINGKTLTAYLPTNQNPRAYVADTDGNYTIHPAMRYAYMTAYNSATHTADGVTMTFKPIVTAVEITLKNISKITQGTTEVGKAIENISGVRITSPYDNIAGKFTANIVNGTVQSVDENEGKNYVEITVRDENGYPITLESGKTLTFTVFMVLPNEHEGLQDLKVSLLQSGTYKTTNIVKNDGLLVQAQKKNFISPVTINWDTNIEVTMDKWLASIDGNTPLGMLSIPGAGGVGSNNLSDENSKQQTLDVEALWNSGIRCFEINTAGNASEVVCNGKSTGLTLLNVLEQIQNKIKANPTEFAIVIVGYESIESTGAYGRNAATWVRNFSSTWESVNSKFTGTSTGVSVDGTTKSISHKTAIFNPNMTLADARGKLFCLSRPTAIGGDPWWYSVYQNAQNVIPVLGWSPEPDQFYARGYTRLNQPFLMGKSVTTTEKIETWYYTRSGSNWWPTYTHVESMDEFKSESGPTTSGNPITEENKNSVVDKGTNYLFPYYESQGVNYNLTNTTSSDHLSAILGNEDNKFMYRTLKDVLTTSKLANGNSATWTFDESLKIYAQEWRRIVKENKTFYKSTTTESDNSSGNPSQSTTINGTTYYYKDVTTTTTVTSNEYYWRENLTEKKNDILTALKKATAANDQSSTIYINSLCGFYVDDALLSYSPQPHRLRFYAASDDGKNEVKEFRDNKYDDYYSSNQNVSMYQYFGGTVGDIANCAKDLNRFFYEELLNLGVENLTGPTGIVIMNRVKNQINSDDDKPGYYLPRFIIENTMRHYGTINDGDIEDSEGI